MCERAGNYREATLAFKRLCPAVRARKTRESGDEIATFPLQFAAIYALWGAQSQGCFATSAAGEFGKTLPFIMTSRDKDDIRREAGASTGARGSSQPSAGRAERAAAAESAGADAPESELSPKVREVVRGLRAEVETLQSELAEARAKVAYLERLADQDTLVPVVNRRAFTRELSRTMSYARRYQVPCSVLYFDLNELKDINDTYGHGAGDAALVRIAETLIASVREFDIVGRLGGDEFAVILVHVDGKGAAEKAAALAAAVEAAPHVYRGIEIPVSVAFGSYQFRPDENVDHAIDAADRAMYARKRSAPDA